MHKIRNILILIAIVNITRFGVNGQIETRLDSVERQLKKMDYDTNRINILNYLSWNYIPIDIHKSKKYCKEAITLSRQLNYKKGLAKAIILNSNICYEMGDYLECLNLNLKGLKMREELGDQWGIAGANGNIGTVYQALKRYDKALEYHTKALKIFKELNLKNPSEENEFSIACCYVSISEVYQQFNKQDDAMKYLNEAVRIFTKINYKPYILSCMNNMGALLHNENKDKEALEYHSKALEISKEIGDKKAESDACFHIANIYLAEKNFKKTITYIERSLSIAKEISSKEDISLSYKLISQAYVVNNDYKRAFEYFVLYNNLKDTIYNEESARLITEMQTKFETEQKEQEIVLLNKDKMLQYSQLNKQRIVIWFVMSGLFLAILIVFIVFRSLRITRKQKRIIEKQKNMVDQKNNMLNQQNEEISSQRDEIVAQRDIVNNQKEKIEGLYKEVTDSINYAKKIQDAIIPESEISRNILGEHFVLFKPKDIVSGDFYFAIKVNEWVIVAVADCTGHGVPGAFMSILGISFLNEIVRKKEITRANHVLNELRIEVIHALKQRGESGEQKDGMDISLFAINPETRECQWAGANNPLCVITKNDSSMQLLSVGAKSLGKIVSPSVCCNDVELYELKGDKMPIAIYPKMKDFTNHEFILQKDDCVYLFSDGYADQFGGPNGRKFMTKQLKEMFVNVADKPIAEQKHILEQNFENWKSEKEQTDDVTILGFKIL